MNVNNKLRQALGSLKDHASIGKAVISGQNIVSDIEIAIIRGTDHHDVPVDDKYVNKILVLVSNAPASITFLARRISSRIETTRDPLVALKTLVLLHRLLRGGDRYFEQDLRNLYSSGDLRMDLRWVSMNSDILFSFLLKYSYFLKERIGWIINQAGRLEPNKPSSSDSQSYEEKAVESILDRLSKCQTLLDRIMDCFPVNISHSSRVAQSAASVILRESFQVYTGFCEGFEILMNSFLKINKPTSVLALDILKRATIQSRSLHEFYENCKRSIMGNSLDYPPVQIITITQIAAVEKYLQSMDGSQPPPTENNSPATRTADHKWIARTGDQEENTGQDTKIETYEASGNLFSCKLETKISMVWVEFDDGDSQNSDILIGRLDNRSSG